MARRFFFFFFGGGVGKLLGVYILLIFIVWQYGFPTFFFYGFLACFYGFLRFFLWNFLSCFFSMFILRLF